MGYTPYQLVQDFFHQQYHLDIKRNDHEECRKILKSEQEAARWFEKAGGQGHAEAQFNLGEMSLETYEKHDGDQLKMSCKDKGSVQLLIFYSDLGTFEKKKLILTWFLQKKGCYTTPLDSNYDKPTIRIPGSLLNNQDSMESKRCFLFGCKLTSLQLQAVGCRVATRFGGRCSTFSVPWRCSRLSFPA